MCDFPECSSIDPQVRRMESLISWLEQWADWQRGYSIRNSYASHSTGVKNGNEFASKDFDDMYDESLNPQFEITDRAIDDMGVKFLPRKCAIYRRYFGISYQFPRDSYPQRLQEAHEWLMVELSRRGVTRHEE